MALLLKDYDAIFLHIPKTGGIFIDHLLRNVLKLNLEFLGYEHSHKNLIGSYALKKYFYFAFIRHPLAWYQSHWAFMMTQIHQKNVQDPRFLDQKKFKLKFWQKAAINPHRPWSENRYQQQWFIWEPDALWHPNWLIDYDCGSFDFSTYVQNCCYKHPAYLSTLFDLYIGKNKKEQIDFVGKTESLLTDLFKILDILEIKYSKLEIKKLKKINQSHNKYKKQAKYTPKSKKLVLESESKLIKRFY